MQVKLDLGVTWFRAVTTKLQDTGTTTKSWIPVRPCVSGLAAKCLDFSDTQITWINTEMVYQSRIVHRVSRKEHVQKQVLQIYHLCATQGVNFEMEWIPRSLTEKSDLLSHIINHGDWAISVTYMGTLLYRKIRRPARHSALLWQLIYRFKDKAFESSVT